MFYNVVNNASAVITAPHTIGDGVLSINPIGIFGSGGFPIRVTCVRQSDNATVIYAIGSSGATSLNISSVLENTADINLGINDICQADITAGAFRDIHSAIDAISASGGGGGSIVGTSGAIPIYSSTGLTEDPTNFSYSKTNRRLTARSILSSGITVAGNVLSSGIIVSGGYNTSNYMAAIGDLFFQNYQLNNILFADNAYYNGSSFTKVTTGYAAGLQFYNGQIIGNVANTGGSTFTPRTPLKIDFNGNVGLGGDMPTTLGSYTGSKMLINASGNVIVGANVGSITPSPVNLSLGGTVGSSIAGSFNNLKLDLFNDNTSGRYGIGMSPSLMEFQAAIGMAFFVNNGVEAMRLTSDSIDLKHSVLISHTTAINDLKITNASNRGAFPSNIGTSVADTLIFNCGWDNTHTYWFADMLMPTSAAFRHVSLDATYGQDNNTLLQFIKGTDSPGDGWAAIEGVFHSGLLLAAYPDRPIVFMVNRVEMGRFDSTGKLSIGNGVTSAGAQTQINSSSASTKTLILKGFTGQTVNQLEVQNSSSTVITSIDASGVVSTKGISTPVVSTSANYTIGSNDDMVLVNAASAPITVMLLNAAALTGSRQFTIKKIDATANVVAISGFPGQTIDGQNTLSISTQWQSYTITSFSGAWYIR